MAVFDSKHGTRLFSKDQALEKELAAFVESFGMSDIVTKFPLFIRRTWLKKFLAHFELFRMIKDCPGDIVELGVFRGLSLVSFALFNEYFASQERVIHGVDNFSGFNGITEHDGAKYDVPKFSGGFSPESFYEELVAIIETFNATAVKTKIELHQGHVEDIVPSLVETCSRIALAHFDVDLYLPTKAGLEHVYPKLISKGVLVFDEYGQMEWSGETKAVDEYFQGKDLTLKKFCWQPAPAAYAVKP